MSDRVKLAVSWAAACGGCDVSLLDIEERLLDLTAIADVVYWPVAIDTKRDELIAMPAGSIDVGLFNGAVRTTEQEEDARVFREKCKVLVAYGACAAFGGIPGLGNLSDREGIFAAAYRETPSTENPDGEFPATTAAVPAGELTLPGFLDTVKTLSQVVPVDVVLPGCPPPTERILDLLQVLADYARDGSLPPAGTVVASEKALCEECPRRDTRQGGRIAAVKRPHEILPDAERCFLEQGLLCLGLATRGGCGASCIRAWMPCRGCFGPTPDLLDPGAEAISMVACLAGEANENDAQPHERMRAVRAIRDPVGTFYRFTLPTAFLNRAISDRPEEV